MKSEHLIEAYNYNNIDSKIIYSDKKSGVIQFNDAICASYFQNEEIVTAIQIFASCLTVNKKNLDNQLTHTLDLLKVISKTIDCICNFTPEEIKEILKSLGLFDGTFKISKMISYQSFRFNVAVADGIILFTIMEVNNNE